MVVIKARKVADWGAQPDSRSCTHPSQFDCSRSARTAPEVIPNPLFNVRTWLRCAVCRAYEKLKHAQSGTGEGLPGSWITYLRMSSAVAPEDGFIRAWNARTPILVEQSNSHRLASSFANRKWSPLARVGGLLTVAWKSRGSTMRTPGSEFCVHAKGRGVTRWSGTP